MNLFNMMWVVIWLTSFGWLTVSHAQVTYMPILEVRDGTQYEDSMLVIDLETGDLIRKLHVGDGVGPVFINRSNTQVFVAAKTDRVIIGIDATQLETVYRWEDLPIEPQQIALSPDQQNLIFAARNESSVYQIDINSGQVSVLFTLPGIQRFYVSENLEFIVFQTLIDETYQLHTWHVASSQWISQTTSSYRRPLIVTNDGTHYITSILGFGLQSRSLVDNSLSWSYRVGSGLEGPIGELSETFTNGFQFDASNALVTGWYGGTYLIGLSDGVGTLISELAVPFTQYAPIRGFEFLQSNRPQQVVCPPIVICPDRGRYLPLMILKHNHLNGEELAIYTQQETGNLADGRYIGENLLQLPRVPLFDDWFAAVILILVIMLVAHRKLTHPNW